MSGTGGSASATTWGRTSAGVYAFERIDDALPYMPLAARRVLDTLGRKLSLEGWLSLPLEGRRRIVLAGAADRVDPAVAGVIDGATPAAASTRPTPEPDAASPPAELLAALAAVGTRPPLDGARWADLSALDRYALVKCASRAEKLAPAYEHIVSVPLSLPLAVSPAVSLTHLTGAGDAHMVDVGDKRETARSATASACVSTTPAVIEAIAGGAVAKGDVLALARVAGILAAKRTPELIPLCHPVRTTRAAIDFEPDAGRGRLTIRATVEAVDRTGVEMEAMVAASIASLAVYDMIKSADRWATIDAVRLDVKHGGKSGDVQRPRERGGVVTAAPTTAALTTTPPTATLHGSMTSDVFVDLRDAALSVDEAIARVQHPSAGAICVFLGTVRDHSDGHPVVRLEYEAYAAMAGAEMNRIAVEIVGEIAGVRLAVVHRAGALVVGDVAVVCAASAPHRAEAYRACRALIDRVKARVPIWKREHGPDGAYWVGWQDARCNEHDAGAHDTGEHRH